MKHWIVACLVVIGTALGFVLGRTTIGRGSERDDLPGGSVPGKSDRHFKTRTIGRDGPRDRDGPGEQSPRMAIRRAARILELSPMAGMDYDALFDAYEAIRWMTPNETRLALEELKATTGNTQVRMTLQSLLIGRWAKQDGRGAVEYAMELEQPMQRVGAMMGGLMGWAKSDPEAAHAWYQENREALSGGMMGTGVVDGLLCASLARTNMKKAFDRLKDLAKSEQGSAIAMMSHQVMMDSGMRREFLAEIRQIEDAKVRRSGLEGLVAQWAMQDPEGAVAFVESENWEDDLGEEMRRTLASAWANLDPEAALDWRLKTAGEQEDRGAAVAAQFSQWMTQAPEAATAWLEKQPEALRTDALYRETSERLRVRGRYELAAQWAEQIEDAERRSPVLSQVYRAWKARDEQAARHWIEGLEAPLRDELNMETGHPDGEDPVSVPVMEARHQER